MEKTDGIEAILNKLVSKLFEAEQLAHAIKEAFDKGALGRGEND